MTLLVGFIVWMIGAVVAWFQIRHWNRGQSFDCPRDYIILSLLSILSWAIYPIYALEWISNELEK